jgi:hypothetical protein
MQFIVGSVAAPFASPSRLDISTEETDRVAEVNGSPVMLKSDPVTSSSYLRICSSCSSKSAGLYYGLTVRDYPIQVVLLTILFPH